MTRPAATSLDALGGVLRAADLLLDTRNGVDVSVTGVCQDSRAVHPGDLFLAWAGTSVDAHDFVAGAVNDGAIAAVVERPLDLEIPQLVVRDGRRAAGLAAHFVMGSPDADLLTVGVTGTNGKTTTAMLIRHLLDPSIPTAVIGTLGLIDRDGPRAGTTGLTTPGPVQVAVWLREMVDGGMGAVVMEASSHALAQRRLDGMRIDIAVFTNLTQDHLDYHGDLGEYFAAKARLVELVSPDGTVLVNESEPAWSALEVEGRTLRSFGLDGTADVRASKLELDARGARFDLSVDGETRHVETPLLGRYNVENALAATAAALAAGIPLDAVVDRLRDAPQVTGRLEAIVTSPFTVLIDFAHTPDALGSALAAVKPLTPGRLIVVFGAGGDRDRSKRRPMAEAVRAVADAIVLTSDNPRTEDPEVILDDLAAGLQGAAYARISDRGDAIEHALSSARPGDTVVLAGKGHETYQIVGTEKTPFDEREIVVACLTALEAN
ncbi:MAG: UDP-N-acetylmuramoyl-L-alanyl-D-glutamate--2,6-diaminopimelate ligase [Gemmatimonadota bacterium]|nr:UDP-N-acetylmuramoyl-L-alanyl-D-glutamate--2,6-diaminopimelate ligase [Gemmatimonadota bacterium]MDH3421988.1 UDP-N-acetylmuramoyl-L-alanyl-D-glutamate--2,6-diaminopimelate ligase [Gemmatimonadota bacterium]